MRLTTLDRCRATGPTPDLGATWTVVIAESSPPDIIINLGCSVFGCASSPARSIKPDEIRRVAKTFTDDQARSVFLMLVLTGLRAGELHRLRWRDVSLVERVLRVVDSKSESGIRSIAIPSSLAEELNGGPRSRAMVSLSSATRSAGPPTRRGCGGHTSPRR